VPGTLPPTEMAGMTMPLPYQTTVSPRSIRAAMWRRE
jgi:hypothetical protein